jgi:hypothetical protein
VRCGAKPSAVQPPNRARTFFFGGPRVLLDVRVEVVVPPLAALLAVAAGQVPRYLRPFLCAVPASPLPLRLVPTWARSRLGPFPLKAVATSARSRLRPVPACLPACLPASQPPQPSLCSLHRPEPASPGADVGESRRRRGRVPAQTGASPGADVGESRHRRGRVPAQMPARVSGQAIRRMGAGTHERA